MKTVFQPDEHTIFLTLAGSHAHGTERPDSDVDLRGVGVATLPSRLSHRNTFEQYEGPLTAGLAVRAAGCLKGRGIALEPGNTETTIFDVAKFVRLCAGANPNTLEILFADPRDWLLESRAWSALRERRHAFLSKKVQQTYLGYALAQLKRIKTHRSWLLNPPKAPPTREDFGLPGIATLSADDRNRIEAAIAAKLRSWSIDDLEMPKATRIALAERMEAFWADILGTSDTDEARGKRRGKAAESLGVPRELLALLDRERGYRAARKHWESYHRWKAERNPARAELEARFGYDTKHAMHLIRLMRTGLELVRTGDLRVRRPDAEALAAIRDGALTYEELLSEARGLEHQMVEALPASPLPADVDEEGIDELLFRVIKEGWTEEMI